MHDFQRSFCNGERAAIEQFEGQCYRSVELIAPEDEQKVLQGLEEESKEKTLIGSVQELRDMLPDLS